MLKQRLGCENLSIAYYSVGDYKSVLILIMDPYQTGFSFLWPNIPMKWERSQDSLNNEIS